jgi:hypothetical protein
MGSKVEKRIAFAFPVIKIVLFAKVKLLAKIKHYFLYSKK